MIEYVVVQGLIQVQFDGVKFLLELKKDTSPDSHGSMYNKESLWPWCKKSIKNLRFIIPKISKLLFQVSDVSRSQVIHGRFYPFSIILLYQN